MRKLMYLTDYFVMVTGRNVRHTQSLAADISRMLKAQGDRPLSVEGLPEGNWVLFDIGDVVVHLFDRATRQFYDLENLWADAPRSRWRKPFDFAQDGSGGEPVEPPVVKSKQKA